MLSAIVGHAVQLSETSGDVIYEYDETVKSFASGEFPPWKKRYFRRFR